MARTELARVEKRVALDDYEVAWRRTTVILLSDGEVLRRDIVLLRATNRLHDLGWQPRSKLVGREPVGYVREFLERWQAKGYEPL